jgi:hypothetical protein
MLANTTLIRTLMRRAIADRSTSHVHNSLPRDAAGRIEENQAIARR